VAKDDLAEYLGLYADHHGLAPRFGVEVTRLERDGEGWKAETGGAPLAARQVVLASGYNREPVLPDWPGRDTFRGELLHASAYAGPERFRGRDVLVVGAGNTGAEIAADLAERGAGPVRIAVRTPPNIVPRQLGPVPITLLAMTQDSAPAWLVDPVNRLLQRVFVGDLTRHGLPAARAGVVAQARATGVTPTIDVGLIKELRAGRVTPVAAVEALDGADVVLADGSRLSPDAVIAATGYSTALEPVVGHLGVLGPRGAPLVHGGRAAPSAPGLRFVGIANPLKGLLFQISLDARAAARAIAGELRPGS
jgi:cation diffusion facilitator CzcD-associated flavoprotein CzcO